MSRDHVVYGIISDPGRAGHLAAIFSPLSIEAGPTLVTSFTEAPEGLAARLLDDRGWARVQEAGKLCAPLVRSPAPAWPTTPERAEVILTQVPQVFNGWVLRNLLWQTLCGGFVYWVDEESIGLLDLTVHLTVAKMLGQTSIGILPSSMRTMLESTQLTLTDVIVGEADTRSLSLLLESLSKRDMEQVSAHGEEEQGR